MPRIENSQLRDEVSLHFRPVIVSATSLKENPELRYSHQNNIGSLDGIEIVQHTRDFPSGTNCSAYVFWFVLQEEWCSPKPPSPIHPDDIIFFDSLDTHYEPHALYVDTPAFLAEKGYQEVDQPENGDVVAYGISIDEERVSYTHFGLFEDNKVISKFGSAHVYRHDLEKIPDGYGNEVTFFRRTQTNMLTNS